MSKKMFTHTYDDIISITNLLEAWQEFKRGKKNKEDVLIFERNLMGNILELHHELREKRYVHGVYEHFVICDPKRRDIHKATVRDRLLHHAIYRILYPSFDRVFIVDSFSCRNGKGTHKAMNRFRYFAGKVSKNHTRTAWVLKCDIRKFFASINHGILLSILKERITDKDILWLLSRIIASFHSTGTGVGLPLGNLTSQLLVNIYMNEFDQYVKHVMKCKYYIRYADDFVFLSENKNYLDEVRQKSEAFLTHCLKLSLHPDKVFMCTYASGVDFLGWVHFMHHLVLRTKTKRRMIRRVSEKNVTSYLGMVSHGNGYGLVSHLKSRI